MSKTDLTPDEYLYRLDRAIDVWSGVERKRSSGSAGGLPRTARRALLDAVALIGRHAKRREWVYVTVTTDDLARWLLARDSQYKNPRDILYQWREHWTLGVKRKLDTRRLIRVYADEPWIGAEIGVSDDADGVRVDAYLTRGTRKAQLRVPHSSQPTEIAFAFDTPPSGDPVERGLLTTTYAYYAQLNFTLEMAAIRDIARRRGVTLGALRVAFVAMGSRLITRIVTRRYATGAFISDLSAEEIESVQRWYRLALRHWQRSVSSPSFAATRDSLARIPAAGSDATRHPDDVLDETVAAASADVAHAARRLWLVDRAGTNDADHAAIRVEVLVSGAVVQELLQPVYEVLIAAGLIDDGEAWADRQYATYDELEAIAEEGARERGEPDLQVQRALRRLASPRIQSYAEIRARRILAQPIPKGWHRRAVREALAEYLRWLELRRVRSSIEQFVEHKLQLYSALYELLDQLRE